MKNDDLNGLLALEGIVEATTLGLEIISHEDILNNKIYLAALERQVEIISEASRKIPESWKALYTDIDWRGLAAVGNVLRHEYKNISKERIYTYAKNDFDKILKTAQQLQDLKK